MPGAGRWAGVGALAVALAALPGTGPAAAGSPCAGDDVALTGASDPEAARQATLCLLARERATRGLPGLAVDERLARAAQVHAQDMVQRDYFAHSAPDPAPSGRDAPDRARTEGYEPQVVVESLAAGLQTPREVVAAWLASDAHCRQLLDGNLLEVGVGAAPPAAAGTLGAAWAVVGGLERSDLPPNGDPRPAAACPYSGLGIGTPPGPPVSPVAGDAPVGAPVGPSTPRTPVLPRAAVRGLVVSWAGPFLSIRGRMLPAVAGHRVVLRVERSGRRARAVVHTTGSGHFEGLLAVRRGDRSGRVKVTVSSVPGRLRTTTAARRLPSAVVRRTA